MEHNDQAPAPGPEGPGRSVATLPRARICKGPDCETVFAPRVAEHWHCTARCRSRAWDAAHPRLGRPGAQRTLFDQQTADLEREERARRRGKAVSAGNNDRSLADARQIALEIAADGSAISIEEVREEADRRGLGLTWGNWAGSVFKGPGWRCAGYTRARHKGSHARMVRVWVRGASQ